ncbi:MAG: hypothetical protein Q4A64_07855 [Porphyromonadaceae bacterium]|nr:hypothetical protein [Porphyromonadaceae bacterium]
MKTIKLALGITLVSCSLIACDREQAPPPFPEDTRGTLNLPEPKRNPKGKQTEPEGPLTADMIALKQLGLKPLDIDSAALPPLPTPKDPSKNIGLDSVYRKWKEERSRKNNERDDFLSTGEYFITSEYIIWGYGKPEGILLGWRTHIADRRTDGDPKWWKDKPAIPLTLSYGGIPRFCDEHSHYNDKVAAHRFDSLTRLHGVVKGNKAFHEHSPMPYDLRQMRIAHNGVDISPLFSIRYQDYKEVIRTGQYSKWYWRDVRISDVGMDVLDWLFDSAFEIYPLTKDYPKFTIVFILKDGTVIKREVEHRV